MTKIALVTGGSSGIGKQITLEFQKLGIQVFVFDVQTPDFEVDFYNVDISKESEIKEAFNEIESLDILVNCAGIYFQRPIEETTSDDLDRMVDINLKGTYLMCKHALPLLKVSSGSVVNIASTLGVITEPNSSLYSAVKAGIIMLTKSMAIDYQKYGIRSNAILPGAVDTPLLREYLDTDEKIVEHGKKKPLGRIANPNDVANVATFLIDPKSNFINGAIISVDGGEACTSLYSNI